MDFTQKVLLNGEKYRKSKERKKEEKNHMYICIHTYKHTYIKHLRISTQVHSKNNCKNNTIENSKLDNSLVVVRYSIIYSYIHESVSFFFTASCMCI